MSADFYTSTPDEQAACLQQLGHAALRAWRLDGCELRLIKYRENAVYAVRTPAGERYALRIHRPGYHSDAELHSELEWMRALAAGGFAVPEIVPGAGGELFVPVAHTAVPEPRQVDLLRWIDGEPLGSLTVDPAADPAAVATTFRTIGQLAARLHTLSSAWTPPRGFVRHAWDTAGLVGERPFWGRFWELDALAPSEAALVLRARDRLRLALGALPRTPDVYGLIHADFVVENLLVDGPRVRLIDFDDAGWGWHLFEIATTLYFHIGQPYYEAVRDATIAGYRSERPLPDAALALLPTFLAARAFTYLGWVHTRRETETARELTPMLIELACRVAEDYLADR